MAKIFFSYIPPLAKQNRRKKFGRKYREERSKEELDQWNIDAWCRNLVGYIIYTYCKVAVVVVIVWYLLNQCLSSLTLWDWIPPRRGVLDTTLCGKVCQWLAAVLWFFPDTPVSSTNKTDCHDITEILLKVASSTIKPNKPSIDWASNLDMLCCLLLAGSQILIC